MRFFPPHSGIERGNEYRPPLEFADVVLGAQFPPELRNRRPEVSKKLSKWYPSCRWRKQTKPTQLTQPNRHNPTGAKTPAHPNQSAQLKYHNHNQVVTSKLLQSNQHNQISTTKPTKPTQSNQHNQTDTTKPVQSNQGKTQKQKITTKSKTSSSSPAEISTPTNTTQTKINQ